ncbi:MAG: putative toxin-antitoxin system toxin component, PIN family [Deltaproteobacteria bacterium]|nr:putative toxin-antitoxin system toxin component, PIN family [Deltaproteobacteria bacterium]
MMVVIDTNVLVSGLLTPDGPPGRILDGLAGDVLRLVYDDRIVLEYRALVSRPRHKFRRADLAELLAYVIGNGERIVAPPLDVLLPDPDDLALLEVAVAGQVDALVTGNLKHFPPNRRRGARVMSPADFLLLWRSA